MRVPTVPTVERTAAIAGAGPAGLLAAVMLAQRGWQRVDVFDALPPPPAAADPSWGVGERSYQLGLNGRGQYALRQFGCMERVDRFAASVRGRLALSPDAPPAETVFKDPGTPGAEKSYVTRVLQRDRLQAVLLEEVAERYPQVRIEHNVCCTGIDLAGDCPALRLAPADADGAGASGPERLFQADLLIGADGVRSAVRDALAESDGTRVTRYVDDNERVYKTLPLHPSRVAGTRSDLNWGSRNASLGIGMDALPTKVARALLDPRARTARVHGHSCVTCSLLTCTRRARWLR